MNYKWLLGVIVLVALAVGLVFWLGNKNQSTQTVGDSVITSDDGLVTLTVPAAAFPEDLTAADIAITKHDQTGEVLYEFTPNGTQFVQPVMVSFTLSGLTDTVPLLIQSDANGTGIVSNFSTDLDYAAETTTVSGTIDHFSTVYVSLYGFFALEMSDAIPHYINDPWSFQVEWNLQKTTAQTWGIKDGVYGQVNVTHQDPWSVSGNVAVPLPYRLITEPTGDEALPEFTELSNRIQFTAYADFYCVEAGDSAFDYTFTLQQQYLVEGKTEVQNFTEHLTLTGWPITCLVDDTGLMEPVTDVNVNASTNSNANAAPELAWVDVLSINGALYPVEQFHLADPDACGEQHWHASGTVYTFDLTGSTTDPSPTGCGFGTVADVPTTTIQVELWEYEVFREGAQ